MRDAERGYINGKALRAGRLRRFSSMRNWIGAQMRMVILFQFRHAGDYFVPTSSSAPILLNSRSSSALANHLPE